MLHKFEIPFLFFNSLIFATHTVINEYVIFPFITVCNADLMSRSKTKFFTVNSEALSTVASYVDIYSNSSWCSGKTISSGSLKVAESLRIDLGDINLVTGIAISGSPYSDSWVTSFDVTHGLLPNEMESLGNVSYRYLLSYQCAISNGISFRNSMK